MIKHLLTVLLVCTLCVVTEVTAQASGLTLSERTAETITLTYDGDALPTAKTDACSRLSRRSIRSQSRAGKGMCAHSPWTP